VLNFHGHGSFDYVQERGSHFSALADQDDFLVAYPQGIVGPDKNTGWDTGRHKDPKSNDVLFVSDLIGALQRQWCIDSDRVYATGFSNGGGMTILLACRLASRIAAFASVSGAYPPFPGGCHPSRPVPILEIHGTADKIVPYNGSAFPQLPAIPDWLSGWAASDGCHPQPAIFYRAASITGERWTGCSDGVTLEHYRIDGGKHHWPAQRDGLDATSTIWSFLQDYSLPSEGVDN
jgi:polyhydroxybutyrate depolymerase